jgi:Glycosyl transferases group 1
MRVLLIGSHRTERIERGVERAMRRAGHDTLLIDDRRLRRNIGLGLTQRWVLGAARRFRPDYVFFSKSLGLTLETAAALARDRPSSLWYQDPQWYGDVHLPDIAHTVAVGRLAGTFFVTGFESEWRAMGLNAKLLPSAADRDIRPVPFDHAYAADVAFIGTGPGVSHGGAGFAPERAEFLASVAASLGASVRVRVWGGGWDAWRDRIEVAGRPVFGRSLSRVCSSSAIVLGINPSRAAGATLYTSDRLWMMVLGGGFYLGRRTPGLDRLLVDGEHCAWYDDVAECVTRARYYLDHPTERARIRTAGEQLVRARHTFDERVDYLLTGQAWDERG